MGKSRHLCATLGCRKRRAPRCSRCYACQKAAYRKKHRMRDAWQHLKDNSKRRKIFNDLTFEQFEEFAVETDYLTGVGRTSLSYSVDRIIEELGYTAGNLQRLNVGDNTRKENERRRTVKMLQFDWQSRYARVVTCGREGGGDFDPF